MALYERRQATAQDAASKTSTPTSQRKSPAAPNSAHSAALSRSAPSDGDTAAAGVLVSSHTANRAADGVEMVVDGRSNNRQNSGQNPPNSHNNAPNSVPSSHDIFAHCDTNDCDTAMDTQSVVRVSNGKCSADAASCNLKRSAVSICVNRENIVAVKRSIVIS